MTCNRIAHPYIDRETGHHKHAGEINAGELSCASVIVTSSKINVEIEVSLQDDFDRQNGSTEFCRSYHDVCPLGTPVLFTAPANAGQSGTPFDRWVKDEADQPPGVLTVEIQPCDGNCHTLRAVYGGKIILEEGCWAGVEVPISALLTTEAIYTQLPCSGGTGCPSNMNPYLPTVCWNSLWTNWNDGLFELDFRRVIFRGDIGWAAEWATHTGYPDPDGFESESICSPAVINIIPGDCVPDDTPGVDQCWCECDVGADCISPVIECVVPPWCPSPCGAPFPSACGKKIWTNAWHGKMLTWCQCDLFEVRLFWELRVSKRFCLNSSFDDCFICDPPGPLCSCSCNTGPPQARSFSIAFGDLFDNPQPSFITGPRAPGESCAVAMQRLWDRVVDGEILAWEGDRIQNTIPGGWPSGVPGINCELRRQETITIQF